MNDGEKKYARSQPSPEEVTESTGRTVSSTGSGSIGNDAAPSIVDRLPRVSLPKGGGAIRGLGEKFSVQQVTGSAGLSVPLPLSPGRSGFTPAHQLSYDSDSGNGVFGFGWKLSLPAIVRKTDKGLPQYDDGNESDVFILSGSEDLVPIQDASGSRVRRERTLHGTNYQVASYRPRIEGLYARIERWENIATGISYWRTISTDNVTTLYGYDASSCVSNPTNPVQIFSYLISRSWDDRGNLAIYDYLPDDPRSVDVSQANEANRDAGVRSTQRYLSMIRYGNVQPYFADWSEGGKEAALPADWMFMVVVDYGNHNQASPLVAPDQVWPVRPDPFSTYRAGFEVRTYRRVKRLLYFNNFPQESKVGADCLVRSTDFNYSDEKNPGDPHNPIYTFVESITENRYRRNDNSYTSAAMPALQFAYGQPQIQPDILKLDSQSVSNAPEGISGSRVHWVDLDGEGLSGILAEWDGAWGYKANLSPKNQTVQSTGEVVTRAEFGPLESVSALPSRLRLETAQQLVDISGAGRLDVVDFARPAPGFFKRTSDGSWEDFKTFQSWPDIDWSEPNLRFVDLTGDGLADILITEDGIYTLYVSLGDAGYDQATQVRTPWDENLGPKVVVSDGTETIFLADMSGDGLHDIVRVRNGEIVYWPSLGYGRFGPKVTMDHAPRFVDEERFDPRRIRLADVDGSGTTDLVYVGSDGVHVCFNQSGNAWATPVVLAVFPAADRLSDVSVLDLLGTGTACVVWSSPLPGQATAPLLYVDLMSGRKPHLLTNIQNSLGAETRITYAPSTRFYVADKLSGRPWVTRLPFPVQVVERVEVFDWIGRNRFVTRYGYHHGYFDGYEREFRGFGMVEQWDTEEFRDDTTFADGPDLNWNQQSWSPPVLTKTWFHTGAFVEAAKVSRQYESEYWTEPALAGLSPHPMLLPDTVLPAGMNAFETQEAYRSLKGKTLRTEVYGEDASTSQNNPYSVEEQNFTIEFLQPIGTNRHAVFFSHPRETLTFHYERNANDPRVAHGITLEVNPYGDVLRSISIGYPRRPGYVPPEPGLTSAMQGMLAHDQERLHVLGTETKFTNAIDEVASPDVYRKPQPQRKITGELTGISPAANIAGVTNLFAFDELNTIWQTTWDGTHDVPYESIPAADVDGGGPPPAVATRRVVQQTITVYRSDDLTAVLAPGVLESLGLPGDSYQQALSTGIVASVFGTLISNTTLSDAGYVQLPGETGWWIPTGGIFYSPGDADTAAVELTAARSNFYLPRRVVDPLQAISRVSYVYNLLPATATDAARNVTSASYDFRVLQPTVVTDPNGNRVQTSFDLLQMVTGTAVMGKTTETVGDLLSGFDVDLDAATIAAHLTNPLSDPDKLLGNLTTRTIYDLNAFVRDASPPTVYTLVRETHVADLHGTTTLYQHSFAYSDGFGRVVQNKKHAAKGPLTPGGPDVSPRWIGSGWAILNNKGKPVRRYEPFFSPNNAFEFGFLGGVSDVLFYDAPGRQVAVLHPDSTWEKSVFDPWRQESWDRNDLVLISDPRTDPDVGNYFLRELGSVAGAFVSWYDLRKDGNLGTTADDQAAQKDAAQKTVPHAGTRAVTHFDALSRVCLTVGDNGGGSRFATRTAFDCQGRTLAVFNALEYRVMEYVLRNPNYVAGTDMAGKALYQNSMDAGERRSLSNVLGSVIRTWDARGHAFTNAYDSLQRPTHRYVSTNGSPPILEVRSIYGEGLQPENLCGKLFRQYDAAGVVIHEAYDFKGNLVQSARQLAKDYHQLVDWSTLANLTDATSLDSASEGLLASEDRFESSAMFDALNRAIQTISPHSATMKANVIRDSFDEGNQLNGIRVWQQQQVQPTALLDPGTADLIVLKGITYNARGQRLSASLGNKTVISYDYDPETFRLTNLVTTRPSTFAQNQQTVQDLFYYYDPVGNVTRIRDEADIQNVIFFSNQRVDPTASYQYDPLYRLIRAVGREHLGQAAPPQVTNDDSPRIRILHSEDGQAMGVYTEAYSYDPVGNILAMAHQTALGGWTRNYTYTEASEILSTQKSNRLSTTSLPGDPVGGPYSAAYTFDAHGNMTKMPHLKTLVWDEEDRLRSTTRQVVTNATPQSVFYVYDASGQRVRKTTDSQAPLNQTGARLRERAYLGALEIYREFSADGSTVTLQRETLHLMDGARRVALIEVRTEGTDPGLKQLTRYQHTNHLESAVLELDDQAQVVTYEEYFPYGSTSYQAVRNATDTPKRYRYTNKERDEENDLYYYGSRYYASWIGRWISCDSTDQGEGVNLYGYVSNNPIHHIDPSGHSAEDVIDSPDFFQRQTNRIVAGEDSSAGRYLRGGRDLSTLDKAKRLGTQGEVVAAGLLTLGAVAGAVIAVGATVAAVRTGVAAVQSLVAPLLLRDLAVIGGVAGGAGYLAYRHLASTGGSGNKPPKNSEGKQDGAPRGVRLEVELGRYNFPEDVRSLVALKYRIANEGIRLTGEPARFQRSIKERFREPYLKQWAEREGISVAETKEILRGFEVDEHLSLQLGGTPQLENQGLLPGRVNAATGSAEQRSLRKSGLRLGDPISEVVPVYREPAASKYQGYEWHQPRGTR